jgi:hypothetical protein
VLVSPTHPKEPPNLPEHIERGALISPDGRYRYLLTRRWAPGPAAVFVMLNPSTADAEVDDPTIRRCMGFARSWRRGGIVVVNLYAYRATAPKELAAVDDPIGPDNNEHIRAACRLTAARPAPPIVCAWGASPFAVGRGRYVVEQLVNAGVTLSCLGKTAAGHPRHPLYVKGSARLVTYP